MVTSDTEAEMTVPEEDDEVSGPHSESYIDSEGEERCETCDKWLERDYYTIEDHHAAMNRQGQKIREADMPRAELTTHDYYDPDDTGACQKITGVGHFVEAEPTRCWMTKQQHDEYDLT